MRKLLSRIFAAPEATKEVVSAAIATGDKLFFTEEEKLESTAAMRDWYIRYLEATEPQTVARRFIAIVITLLWASLVIAAAIAGMISKTYSDFLLKLMFDIVAVPFGGIMAFYFATHLTRAVKSKG